MDGKLEQFRVLNDKINSIELELLRTQKKLLESINRTDRRVKKIETFLAIREDQWS